jgi:hypothetical protein
MSGAIPPLPQNVLMAWCLVKHTDFTFFTFYLYWVLLSPGKFNQSKGGWFSQLRPLHFLDEKRPQNFYIVADVAVNLYKYKS